MVVTSSELEDAIAQAVEHRRNFAIISHSDAERGSRLDSPQP